MASSTHADGSVLFRFLFYSLLSPNKPKRLKGVLSLMVQFHDFYWPCEILGYQMKLSKIFNFKIVKLINVLLFHKFYSQNQIICPGQRREEPL